MKTTTYPMLQFYCRFGDFVSDQVVAPVRETTAMALGNLMKLMKPNQLEIVIEALLELTKVGKLLLFSNILWFSLKNFVGAI